MGLFTNADPFGKYENARPLGAGIVPDRKPLAFVSVVFVFDDGACRIANSVNVVEHPNSVSTSNRTASPFRRGARRDTLLGVGRGFRFQPSRCPEQLHLVNWPNIVQSHRVL